MSLAATDIEHIEEVVERLLLEKKLTRVPDRQEERQESPSSFLSERDLLERILSIEMELKNRGELLEKILYQMDKRFEESRQDMNNRFEQVDKRFEELRQDMNRHFERVDKRFEQVDKRFEELRQDTNKRFEELRQDTNKRFEELRQDTNRRFAQLFWFIGLFIPLNNALLLFGLNYILK